MNKELSIKISQEPGANSDKDVSSSAADDAVLLEQVRAGDPAGLGSLYDRYSQMAYSVAMRVLRDKKSAEDVLHEVFMQIWRHPDSFPASRGSIAGLVAIVARNRSIEVLRRKRFFTTVDDIALDSPVNITSSTTQRARSAIQHLSREQRKSVEMAFFDGLTHAEIAEVTGESPSTVKSHVRSALLAVREACQR